MQPCEVCGRPGQRHHIIFRSHGGMDIKVNYCYLCAWHHTQGPDAPHRSREADLRLKVRLQRDLENMFRADEYHLDEIAKIIGYDRRRLARKMRNVPHQLGKYGRRDIITFLMGGRLYEDLHEGHGGRIYGGKAGFTFLDSGRD